MTKRFLTMLMMLASFAAVAPAANVFVSVRPAVAIRVYPVAPVIIAPRYYVAPVYPVFGIRTYGYRYSYGARYYRGYHRRF
jgi:hypothetical protein